jgi:hypothetical protein
MPIKLLTLPISAEELAELGREGYSLVDQGALTPRLLIAQAPEPALNGRREPAPEPVEEPASC